VSQIDSPVPARRNFSLPINPRLTYAGLMTVAHNIVTKFPDRLIVAVPPDLIRLLDEEARSSFRTRSETVRRILLEHLRPDGPKEAA
jgi:Ribbon-helix-helix protein, copG family